MKRITGERVNEKLRGSNVDVLNAPMKKSIKIERIRDQTSKL